MSEFHSGRHKSFVANLGLMCSQFISRSANFAAKLTRDLHRTVDVLDVPGHVPKLLAAVRTTGNAARTWTAGRAAVIGWTEIFGRLSMPGTIVIVEVFVVDVEVVRVWKIQVKRERKNWLIPLFTTVSTGKSFKSLRWSSFLLEVLLAAFQQLTLFSEEDTKRGNLHLKEKLDRQTSSSFPTPINRFWRAIQSQQ